MHFRLRGRTISSSFVMTRTHPCIHAYAHIYARSLCMSMPTLTHYLFPRLRLLIICATCNFWSPVWLKYVIMDTVFHVTFSLALVLLYNISPLQLLFYAWLFRKLYSHITGHSLYVPYRLFPSLSLLIPCLFKIPNFTH